MPDPGEKRPTIEELVAAMDDTIATLRNGTGPLADDLIISMERQLRLVTKEHRKRRRIEKIERLIQQGTCSETQLDYFQYRSTSRPVIVKEIHPTEELVKVMKSDANHLVVFWADPLQLEMPTTE